MLRLIRWVAPFPEANGRRCSGGTCFAEGGERGGAGDGEALLGKSEAWGSARGSAHITCILRHVAAGLCSPPAGAAHHGRGYGRGAGRVWQRQAGQLRQIQAPRQLHWPAAAGRCHAAVTCKSQCKSSVKLHALSPFCRRSHARTTFLGGWISKTSRWIFLEAGIVRRAVTM